MMANGVPVLPYSPIYNKAPTKSGRRSQRAVPADDDEPDYGDNPDHGSIADVKNLYQSKPDDRGRSTWVDKVPEDLEEAAENAETARYALLIRNKKCYDGRKKLEIDSVVVQSRLLKEVLAKVLLGYPGVTTSIKRLVFVPPFQPFVHRWEEMENELEEISILSAKNNKDTDAEMQKEHLELLFKILKEELMDTVKAKNDLVSHGVITFELVWTIFEPGSIVIAGGEAFRLQTADYDIEKGYILRCQCVDWDGEQFGMAARLLTMPSFKGTMPIQQLPVFPLKYHADVRQKTEDLIKRGRRFQQLSGFHYKTYNGIAFGMGFCGPIKYTVNSRIAIDASAWNQFNPNRAQALSRLEDISAASLKGIYTEDHFDASNDATRVQSQGGPGLLKREQLLIASAQVKGYSLQDKEWLTFSIDLVEEIKWNKDAFASLVIPENQKELVLAVAESQAEHKDSFDDVIKGKGKGMIMLLSGGPGVGKTLTAESVAETMRVPLYMMSAVDLGVDAAGIEKSLGQVLKMVTHWNAVLLLDEADVFLEQRTAHDLERNKLVSIFLRTLEYYSGTLFLTTNRVAVIDEAFQSRIHVRLSYQPLSVESRRRVWSNFLNSCGREIGFSEEDLDDLARKELNGRQIKNLLKTALLLAAKKKAVFKKSHIETVLSIDPQ